MLARLQRLWVFVLVLLAAASAAWALCSGASWWMALVVALATLHVHAAVLAVEFMALAKIDPG